MSIRIPQSRFRLRNPMLKNADVAEEFSERLDVLSGVSRVEVNPRVGSLLVVFDAEEATADEILSQISAKTGVNCSTWLTRRKCGRASGKQAMRRNVKLGLAASLGGTVLALAVSDKTHALGGMVFLSFLVAHSFQNRRSLMR
ncbi:MAG: hypothetical protein MI802_12855 [Desulfobacterales bacterium]|nr:hypothetical protein [Desulfobacterales bacterium]